MHDGVDLGDDVVVCLRAADEFDILLAWPVGAKLKDRRAYDEFGVCRHASHYEKQPA